MPRILQFNQANFIGGLTPPNNNGVCFSLSVDWLAYNCNLAQLAPLADTVGAVTQAATAGAIWVAGSVDPRNVTQNAANTFAAGGGGGLVGLVTAVQGQYPAIKNVSPINAGGATTIANLNADVTGGIYKQKLIWLQPTLAAAAGGNRGHVVACNVNMRLWFDANFGVYSGGNPAIDFANHVINNYNPGGLAAGPYPTYSSFELNV
jgi:hypothetical protein